MKSESKKDTAFNAMFNGSMFKDRPKATVGGVMCESTVRTLKTNGKSILKARKTRSKCAMNDAELDLLTTALISQVQLNNKMGKKLTIIDFKLEILYLDGGSMDKNQKSSIWD
jgi:hypothetical protein